MLNAKAAGINAAPSAAIASDPTSIAGEMNDKPNAATPSAVNTPMPIPTPFQSISENIPKAIPAGIRAAPKAAIANDPINI